MRVKHTILNITVGLLNQFIITVLSFVSRTVFINSLGIEYLGLNALFTSLLAMLSLAEAGIGVSIVYNLYKPISEQDQPKIMSLMRLYKNAYRIIALIVMLIGLMAMPFLQVFIDTDIPHLELVYLIFLFNTALPYLFVYKHSFLNVNQKNYIVTAVYSFSTIISTSLKIVILHYTENYLLFLVVECIISITTSILLAKAVDRMYPYLKIKSKEKLDSDTKANFIKNMKAILIQNIGTYFIFGVENILISSFVSIVAVGMYSNYKMLIDICRTFINQVFGNMYNSMGNLIAKENSQKVYSIFRVTQLISFWLYSLFASLMFLFVNPFIKLWLGDDFVLDKVVLILLLVTFYERGIRNAITMLKTTSGIFHEDRFAPLLQAFINLSASLVLVHFWGLSGIFMGGLISAFAVPFWSTPYLVFKRVFDLPLISYYLTNLYYIVIALLGLFLSYGISTLFNMDSYAQLIIQCLFSMIAINALYTLFFYRCDEFKYLLKVFRLLVNKVTGKSYVFFKKRVVRDDSL
ncbi:hypothetical protein RB620_27890 [Paenibacillus sp. LHD-117]|uniref:lipopolysaccharide biosynthesis protein n=1 Tax=Paenibacillus sp. LHD-117 TaxID=3071412 RepID=UPI0027E03BA9|nr:hypothetical protein [Paenibacillus sp. LHD-117]MDQ6423256.1 hypothetical protein [Paenibacillus sp. LHD-117]